MSDAPQYNSIGRIYFVEFMDAQGCTREQYVAVPAGCGVEAALATLGLAYPGRRVRSLKDVLEVIHGTLSPQTYPDENNSSLMRAAVNAPDGGRPVTAVCLDCNGSGLRNMGGIERRCNKCGGSVRLRKKSEVTAARSSVAGCCNRFAAGLLCDCLKQAIDG